MSAPATIPTRAPSVEELTTCSVCRMSRRPEELKQSGGKPSTVCKPCHAAYMRERYQRDKDRLRPMLKENSRRWRERDPEHAKAIARAAAKRNYHADIHRSRAKSAKNTRIWKEKNPSLAREVDHKFYVKNSDRISERSKRYRLANLKRIRAVQRDYYERNSHAIRARATRWKKDNPAKAAVHRALRRAATKRAMPAWADAFAMEEAFDLARMRSALTGVPHSVDHIVPLRSSRVCGLHCEFNLRVIPAVLNASKGNRHWPDMPGSET